MPRSSNGPSAKSNSTRAKPKTGRASAGVQLDKIAEKTDKLPPNQKQAIEQLQLGQRYAGRDFKRVGSEKDRPIVEQRPPMLNESDRTNIDRGGGRKKN